MTTTISATFLVTKNCTPITNYNRINYSLTNTDSRLDIIRYRGATISQQASLISNMEIFIYLGILGAFITLIIFLFAPAKTLFMRLRIPYL